VSALREIRGNLELLARLNGELRATSNLSLHKHLHIEAAQSEEPRSVEDLDLEIARGVAEVTENFDPKEIERLRLLVHPVLQ
jgi:hypothetical protein